MQDKITIADAPECLNTNDKAMWVLGYEAALAARSTCLHQIQEPAPAQAAPAVAEKPDEAQIKALMRKHRTWIEHSTLFEDDEPPRELRAVQAEQHQFESFVRELIALAATPAAPAAAAPVVLPEPDAPIKEVMTLVELHRQEIIKVMDEEGSLVDVQSAQDAIESKLRALLATATGLPAQAVLDYPWRDRLLDGRELVRDQQGFAEHSELPLLDEGMKPRAFFAALGVEMKHTMADDDLSMDEYDAMSDAENWSAWTPRPPIGDAWNLVAIFDTEDGPAAWWARAQKESREAAPQAQADARDAEITWPKARDVGRLDDMSPGDSIRVGLDSDNDVYVSVCGGGGVGSVEFCNPGGSGGGESSRTRLALIALMVAMEADNAEKPSRDWWAQRAAIATAKGEQQS